MLEHTPIPSEKAVVTDYTEERMIGRHISMLVGHLLNGVTAEVFTGAKQARAFVSENRRSPPAIFVLMWPLREHFSSKDAYDEEVRQLGWLIWHLEDFTLKGICHIIVVGVPGREEIEARLRKLRDDAEETKRFNLQVERELEQHRPLGEPRQPPITDYVEMGQRKDAVDKLCLLLANCYQASSRSRAKA